MAANNGTELFLDRSTRVLKIQQIAQFLAQIEGKDPMVRAPLCVCPPGRKSFVFPLSWAEQGKRSSVFFFGIRFCLVLTVLAAV